MIVGLPGILLALLVWLTIKEPPRGMADDVELRSRNAKAPACSRSWASLGVVRRFVT